MRRRKPTSQQNARSAQRLFEYKKFWLGQEAGSGYFYYYWYDRAKRKTQRRATGERELEAAKEWLVNLLTSHPPDEPLNAKNVRLSEVEKFYFKYHADEIRSKNAAKRAFALVHKYLRQSAGENEKQFFPMVADFGLARQEGFMLWCKGLNLSSKTISTYLSTIKAAFNFAARERLVRDATGAERVARFLESAPYVKDNEAEVAAITGLPRSQPRKDIPSDAEMAAFLGACGAPEHQHVFRFAIMALNTWARPEAILDLSVLNQVDFELGLINLNPPGRAQNKKHRPVIRLTDNLRAWLLCWDRDRPLFKVGQPSLPLNNVDNRTLAKICVAAGVGTKITKYTFRHYMATRIRNVPGIPVSREQRGEWIGHRAREFSVMQEFYESFDPDYLSEAKMATDAILARLDTHCKISLRAPGMVAGTNLVVVSGGLPVGGRGHNKAAGGGNDAG